MSTAAWKTGLSLDNVELRTEAFEYLQLPFRLVHGRVGAVQAQVPWQALRSPVVLELYDVRLTVCLRSDDDLHEGPASQRAWAAKQAELAAEELRAMAAASGGAAAAGPTSAPPAGRGVLWSFLQHIINMLINRLQLTVRNVHVAVHVRSCRGRLALPSVLLAWLQRAAPAPCSLPPPPA